MKIKLRDIILFMVFVFILSIFFILFRHNEKNDFSNVKAVTDSTQYYDVSSIVNKVVHNSNKDSNLLIYLIEDSYKRKKNINKKNIFKYIKELDKDLSFSGDKMYYEKTNENISKYYVSGSLQSLSMDNNEIIDDYYVIILIDNNNKTFSVIPDDGKIFMEVEKWMQR